MVPFRLYGAFDTFTVIISRLVLITWRAVQISLRRVMLDRLGPISLCRIRICLVKGTIFGKILFGMKHVFRFPLQVFFTQK
jgi:hypothetical protein